MTFDDLNAALAASRIPWERIVDAGHSIIDIGREARLHGDVVLYQRAKAAAARRGLWF